jgi:methylated-DNA-[protein]-cysteine S-methyltransferase
VLDSRRVVLAYVLFPTPIGQCSMVWSERGVVALGLPEGSLANARKRMRECYPEATEHQPPPEVRDAMRRVVALLEGIETELSGIQLDWSGIPAFHRRVYELTRRVPFGATVSYGDIATRLGSPGAARAVGQALGRNPWALIVPCHRVLSASGRLTGFSAPGGVATKRRLLLLEGVATHITR